MPKRTPTDDPQLVIYPNGTFFVRVGDRERSLKTKDLKTAIKRKPIAIGLLDQSGEASARLRVCDIWPSYDEFRQSMKIEKLDNNSGARRRQKTISTNTLREIEGIWRLHLKPFFGEKRISRAGLEELWIEYVAQSTLIDLANHRKVWRGFLKWCKSKRYVKYIPDLPIPSVERRERRVLKPHEIRKLFEHANGSVLLFISMYLFMGMRRKEIMTLRWSNVHLDERYLVLQKGDVKTRRGRPLPINPFVADLLVQRMRDQRANGQKTDFVFPNRTDSSRHAEVSGLKTAWRRIMRLCKFEPGYITPHDLRATFEAYAHKATAFTDTQREKFAGAAIDIQKKTYVRFDADDIRGLESVVQVDGLERILLKKLTGKQRGDSFAEVTH